MTSRKPLLLIATASLMFSGALLAQDRMTPVPPAPPGQMAPPPPPVAPLPPAPPASPMPPQPPAAPAASYPTPQGELTVRSSIAPAATGPAPDFAQLAGKGKSISATQAASYPPLANDFEYADHNRDGRISSAEYQAWLKHK